jgi:catechol 2,3-dioxygenase-like lactoylglutathione lyase family enzyme
MLGPAKLIAFCATVDGARARAFYEGVLGLRVVSDDPFGLALEANGTLLRIQKVASFTPAPFTALGWQVRDIGVTIDQLVRAGIELERYPGLAQDDRGIWRSPSGALVAWFRDPDRNTLSVTQF